MFRRVPLRDLGIKVFVGHRAGEGCPRLQAPTGDFTIIDVSGIHQVAMRFCGCNGAPDRWEQLYEAGLWPATCVDPKTAATFACLRSWHVLNLKSKLTITHYTECMEILMDGESIMKVPVNLISIVHFQSTHIPFQHRIDQMRLMGRQYRHIHGTKRAGRCHDPTGIEGTPRGGLAVPCRACPRPGVNLPEGWERDPDAECVVPSFQHFGRLIVSLHGRLKYGLILGEDACFKQKGRASAISTENDPCLGAGMGMFVLNQPYLDHVAITDDNDEEVSRLIVIKVFANVALD